MVRPRTTGLIPSTELLPGQPTKLRRFKEEENHAAKQEGRTMEAQASCLARKLRPRKRRSRVLSKPSAKAAGTNRAEGIRLFKLAGRPSKEDFVTFMVPLDQNMTWDQRASCGRSREKFQAALAAKQSGR